MSTPVKNLSTATGKCPELSTYIIGLLKTILALCVVAMFLSCGPISQVGGIPFNSSVTITAEAASKKIHLKKKSITITVGETYTQKLINKKGETITARNITWKSKNKKIAKIDKNGKVTAVKSGKVTLSAKYKGETYNFSVVVKKAKFAKEKITIRVGETFKQKLKDAKVSSTLSESNLLDSQAHLPSASISPLWSLKSLSLLRTKTSTDAELEF